MDLTIQFSVSSIHNSCFKITLLKTLTTSTVCCKYTVLNPTWVYKINNTDRVINADDKEISYTSYMALINEDLLNTH